MLQHRQRVQDVGGLAGGDVGALADVGAHREEGRVEAAVAHGLLDVRDLRVQLERHAHVEDALHLGVEHVARQPVLGDAEAHHAAGHRPGLVDRHLVAEPGEVVGGGEPGGPGTHHQNPLAGRLGRRLHSPAVLDRLVAEEALDRVDAHRLVELAAVAGGLARVVADAPHDRRERVVLHDLTPGCLVAVAAVLGVVEPLLDVLAGRTGVVAGRQPVDVDGPLGAPAAGLVGEARADVQRDREGLLHQRGPPCVSTSRRVRLLSSSATVRLRPSADRPAASSAARAAPLPRSRRRAGRSA